MNRLCSGLNSSGPPCDKRSQCANYMHWTDDMRSEFNICTMTGQPLKHFVPRDIPAALVQQPSQQPQRSLF